MASKRDQLQAHQFLAQRVISALVTRETDPEQPPFKRPSGAAFGSIVITVLALVAVGVYGFIVPGGDKAWRDGDSVLVVKETGTRYVYLNERLHPVLNYSSALLALGANAETHSVSRESLMDVPRGPLIGIPDAPDSLPGTDKLLDGAWSLCSRPGADVSGSTVDESVLMVGAEPEGGQGLGDAALLVEVPESGDQYLIWQGHRHRIRQPDAVSVALALRSQPKARVGMSLIDVLPPGESLGPIEVARAGSPSTAVPRLPDLRAGQVLEAETTGGGVQHYLAEPDRLRPISPLQYDIQLADPATTTAYGGSEPVGVTLGLAAAAEARQSPPAGSDPGSAPVRRPSFAGQDGASRAVCVSYDPGATTPAVRTGAALPSEGSLMETPLRTDGGSPLADRVFVPPGRAALVEVMPSAEASAGTVLLVTDQGRAYPLAAREVLGILGYDGVEPVRLPAGLVTRLPMGSGLDPEAALRT
ncbi:type VII secretion protein EccB [Prauserella cavernicola]|uniref:Type VII secretion protein EccB n=1 Tax=Prauserella cavernicola TaxID=2800127 RepID=A0A934V9Q4_9PSEU|nr:type VII secretion protein EccB [Prauserella cavernicola]MBK1789088.1 type VII secretion protein EccB [Prauserella cavernicola]